MKVVLHVGMHKTGSTSIQQTFGPLAQDRYLYPALTGTFNHSGPLTLMFGDAERIRTHRWRHAHGFDDARLEKMRGNWERALRDAIETSDRPVLVISGEVAETFRRSELERMREFFGRYSDDIGAFAYIRPPASFAASAVQQRLKQPMTKPLDPFWLWRKYRNFKALDQVFGRDRVTLRPFRRDGLENGSVIDDFAAWLGVTVPPEARVHGNEGLSLPAVSLLFTWRSLGTDAAEQTAGIATEARFWKRLATIPGPKLRFSAAFLQPAATRYADDLAWMEARLGQPLNDMPDPEAAGIGGAEDFHAVALAHHDALRALLDDLPTAAPWPARAEAAETPMAALLGDLGRLRQALAQIPDAD